MKYYATNANSFFMPVDIQEKFNLEKSRRQYRVVIKAKSRASANRRWKEITGKSHELFKPDYTSTTGNSIEVEMCDQHGEIIGSSLHGVYHDLKLVVKEINAIKESILKD